MPWRNRPLLFALSITHILAQPPITYSFPGNGPTSIQALATDAAGNIFVAATTAASNLPTKNAHQSQTGEVPLMRSADNGQSWQKVPNVPAGTLEIAPHPANPQILLIAGANGIDKSTDGGQSWRHVHTWQLPFRGFVNLAFDPASPNLAYAIMLPSNGFPTFLATENAGDTWEQRSAQPINTIRPNRQLWVDPHGTGAIYLGFATSRDRGLSWQPMNTLTTGSFADAIVPDPHHPGWLFALSSSGAVDYLDLSTNGGASWTPRSPATQITIDPDIPNLIYANNGRDNLISRDNAATWTPLPTGPLGPFTALPRRCNGGALLATNTQVSASPDFGQSWNAPQLDQALKLTAAPACTLFAVRTTTSDAFLAKLSPTGELLWSTYLGGPNADSALALATGPNGSIYLAGYTTPTATFVSRFDADGALLFNTTLPRAQGQAATTLSVDLDGNAYLAGTIANTGFVTKLSPAGDIQFTANPPYRGTSTIPALGIPSKPFPLVAIGDGSALVAGDAATLSRLSPDGATRQPIANLPGPIHLLATDAESNIYIADEIPYLPVNSQNCYLGYVFRIPTFVPPADTYITKLKATTYEPIFTKRLTSDCRSQPVEMKIAPSGEVTLGLSLFGQIPLRDPVSATPTRSAIVRLAANGDDLQFATYATQSTTLAASDSNRIYTASNLTPNQATITKLPILASPTLAIESIADALSGRKGAIPARSLVTITGRGFATETIDMGLASPGPLPRQLAGVQVLVNGAPTELLQVSPDHVTFLATDSGPTNTVQVTTATETATPFTIAYEGPASALLTNQFPALPSAKPDGAIRNADGSENSPTNPAARGTTVTLYSTGLTTPGPIDLSWAPKP